MEPPQIRQMERLYPRGSKVRIVKDSLGLGSAELHDSYTVVNHQCDGKLSLRDSFGNRFNWPVSDCVHPGPDMEWILRSGLVFAKGGPVRRALRALVGKRFLRLRPSVRDIILLQQPDLKERILQLLSSLQP